MGAALYLPRRQTATPRPQARVSRRTALLALAALLLFNAALRFTRLDAPPQRIFDEATFYVPAAQSYLEGRADPNFEHPPLGKAAIASGMAVFGDTPWGWRSAAAAAGTLGVLLTYVLGAALWGRREAGLIAATLLTFETLWFILARMAMLDPFLSVGLLAALVFGWRYHLRPRPIELAAAAVCLGLAATVKWSGLLALAPLALAVVTAAHPAKPALYRRLLPAAVLPLVAAAVYLLVFAAFSGLGPLELAERHIRMVAYQSAAGVGGAGLWERIGPPLLWLVNIPILLSVPGHRDVWVLAMAHPLVLWPGVLATAALLREARHHPAGPAAFLALAILALYVPWLLTPRARYVYYLMPLLPLLCVAIAGVVLRAPLSRHVAADPAVEVRQRTLVIVGYLAAVALMFAALYPPLTAMWR